MQLQLSDGAGVFRAVLRGRDAYVVMATETTEHGWPRLLLGAAAAASLLRRRCLCVIHMSDMARST